MNGITPIYRKILSITVHFGKKKELETSNNTQIFMWIGEWKTWIQENPNAFRAVFVSLKPCN